MVNAIQTNIFDFLSLSADPLYQKVCELSKGSSAYCSFGNKQVLLSRNQFDLFEVEGESFHTSFSSIDACYEFLNKLSNEWLWGEDQ